MRDAAVTDQPGTPGEPERRGRPAARAVALGVLGLVGVACLGALIRAGDRPAAVEAVAARATAAPPAADEPFATGPDGCPKPRSDTEFPPLSPADPAHCESHYNDFVEIQQRIDLTAFETQLEHAFGERFGGTWGDGRVRPSLLLVGIVGGPTPADEATLATLTGGWERVRLAPVTYSKAQLKAFADQIFPVLWRQGMVAGLAPDFYLNKVIVLDVAVPPELKAEVARLIPPDAVHYQPSGGIRVEAEPVRAPSRVGRTPKGRR